jgi:hypothetical protein
LRELFQRNEGATKIAINVDHDNLRCGRHGHLVQNDLLS